MIRAFCLVVGITLLAGCATTEPPGQPVPPAACDALPVQGSIGQTATEALGAELLRRTGARQLRWLAPGMAATMDFRPDRLSVSYDDKMVIERITCG